MFTARKKVSVMSVIRFALRTLDIRRRCFDGVSWFSGCPSGSRFRVGFFVYFLPTFVRGCPAPLLMNGLFPSLPSRLQIVKEEGAALTPFEEVVAQVSVRSASCLLAYPREIFTDRVGF